MATVPIVVPQLGVVQEVFVVEWLGADGDQVSEGQPVVVIESEKAETEVAAPAAGRLEIVLAADPDAEIEVGATLGNIVTP